MVKTAYFDQYGRCIPEALMAKVYEQSRRYFSVVQPKINYAETYQRFDRVFDIANDLSLQEFERRAEAILNVLSDTGITQSVGVPIILPKADYSDIGQAIDDIYLKAVQQSFNAMFPDYSFVNHNSSSLAGQFSIASGSRHDKLIDAMKEGVVVAYFFPCLLEYSVPAAIEQISHLPEQFLLAGGFDTAAAFIGNPDLLVRKDGYAPLLWMSGLNVETEGVGYHFESYGYDLTFNRRVHLAKVAEYWASSLVVLG